MGGRQREQAPPHHPWPPHSDLRVRGSRQGISRYVLVLPLFRSLLADYIQVRLAAPSATASASFAQSRRRSTRSLAGSCRTAMPRLRRRARPHPPSVLLTRTVRMVSLRLRPKSQRLPGRRRRPSPQLPRRRTAALRMTMRRWVVSRPRRKRFRRIGHGVEQDLVG